MKDKLKDKKVKCRICNGEHFTARCPFKDTMAPVGEEGAADVAAGMPEEPAGPGGLGAGKSSYVPPHLRNGGAAASAGDRMGGGKFERDDLATLRVTNVSPATAFLGGQSLMNFSGLGNGRRTRASRHVRAVRQSHPSILGQRQGNGDGQRICFHIFPGANRCGEGLREDGRLWFQALDSASRVCQKGCINASWSYGVLQQATGLIDGNPGDNTSLSPPTRYCTFMLYRNPFLVI